MATTHEYSPNWLNNIMVILVELKATWGPKTKAAEAALGADREAAPNLGGI